MEGKPRGTLGIFPEIIRQRRVTQSSHTGYYDSTTTATGCHGSYLSNPVGFLSFLPWAPPHPFQQPPNPQGEGPQLRRKGPWLRSQGSEGRGVAGLAGGTVGGRGGVSGWEEWRSGKGSEKSAGVERRRKTLSVTPS